MCCKFNNRTASDLMAINVSAWQWTIPGDENDDDNDSNISD